MPLGLVLQDRYRLDAHVAVGGMGEVWRGTDLVLERRVAVKVLRPEYAQDEEDLARFRAEARHAGSLSHPNIAQVYDYCEAGPPGARCLVMEFVDGPSLARLLDEGPMDPGRTMDIVAQAARGLEAAHAAGLIHRDIKPGNLLVSASGWVKVTDFGIAYATGAAPVTQTGVLIGTPAYLAPERAAGATATPAADLYALGVVAHQCLTGRVPFDGEPLAVAIAHLEREMPPLPPSVPAEVAALIADLTAKDPLARPSSAGEVAARADRLVAPRSGAAAAPVARPVTTSAAAGMTLSLSGLPQTAADSGARRLGWPRALRIPAGQPGRAVLGLTGVMAASMASWMLVTMPGSVPMHQPSSARPHASRQAGPRAVRGPRPVSANRTGASASDAPAAGVPAAGAPADARPSSSSPGQPLAPSPTPASPSAAPPAPSPTATPSSAPPAPSATPTPTASPSALAASAS